MEIGEGKPHSLRFSMVVIIGAGITGAASAYYLSKFHGSDVKIFDAVGPAACASGKAGAFLAESWSDGTKTEMLHRKSFELHETLAEDLGLKSFRPLPAFRGNLEEASDGAPAAIPWLSSISHTPVPGRAAQVDPAELTCALLEKAMDRGATLEIASVDGFDTLEGRVSSIRFENGTDLAIPHDEDIVVALGPWTCRLEDWLNIPLPIEGVRSTSLVFEAIEDQLVQHPAALFCEEDSNGCHLEIFPRSDNSLFISGCGRSKQISPATLRGPDRPVPGSEGDESAWLQGRAVAAMRGLQALPFEISLTPTSLRACTRPVSPDGVPIVGKVSENVFVATGGGTWGITWGPLLGMTVAYMLREREAPIRVKDLNPSRFDTLIYRTLLEQRGKEAWG